MSLFVRKDLGLLLAEAGSGTLRRELGPLALVTLGIGAVIGAGIFVLTGSVASQNAGPALTLSMVLAGFACAFAMSYVFGRISKLLIPDKSKPTATWGRKAMGHR